MMSINRDCILCKTCAKWVTSQGIHMTYNLGRFRLSDYDLTQFPGPKVGEPAPDFELTGLDGNPVQKSFF